MDEENKPEALKELESEATATYPPQDTENQKLSDEASADAEADAADKATAEANQ